MEAWLEASLGWGVHVAALLPWQCALKGHEGLLFRACAFAADQLERKPGNPSVSA